MRKIILMAVAGYLWKKFKAGRAAAPVASPVGGRFSTSRAPGAARAAAPGAARASASDYT